jgi:hypothetical protein
MALLSRLYWNAVFGALGGLVGWMLFGVFGDKYANSEIAFRLFFFIPLTNADVNSLLGGSLIGGAIGYFVVSVDAIRDRSFQRFVRLASYGVLLNALGGALGMLSGEKINDFLNRTLIGLFDYRLLIGMAARGLGWSLLGVAIGMTEGIAARSRGKFSYGAIGGAIGGFLGGVLFELFHSFARQSLETTYFWSAMGLVILGACIGSLSALVQNIFQPASVRILRGWQEGREYPLDKTDASMGRDEHVDIPLFRDMKVEKHHAFIQRQNEAFVLINNGAPAEWTRVNDIPVADRRILQDGDRIQLGNVLLRFQTRAAANRAVKKLRPAAA